MVTIPSPPWGYWTGSLPGLGVSKCGQLGSGSIGVAGVVAGSLCRCLAPGGELYCYELLSSDQVILPAAEVVFGQRRVRGYTRLALLQKRSASERTDILEDRITFIEKGILATTVEVLYP